MHSNNTESPNVALNRVTSPPSGTSIPGEHFCCLICNRKWRISRHDGKVNVELPSAVVQVSLTVNRLSIWREGWYLMLELNRDNVCIILHFVTTVSVEYCWRMEGGQHPSRMQLLWDFDGNTTRNLWGKLKCSRLKPISNTTLYRI